MFVLAIKVLSHLLERAREGSYLSGIKARGKEEEGGRGDGCVPSLICRRHFGLI